MSKQHQSHVKGVTTPDLTLTPIRTGLIQRHLVSSSGESRTANISKTPTC